jgi:hypothetical protein
MRWLAVLALAACHASQPVQSPANWAQLDWSQVHYLPNNCFTSTPSCDRCVDCGFACTRDLFEPATVPADASVYVDGVYVEPSARRRAIWR